MGCQSEAVEQDNQTMETWVLTVKCPYHLVTNHPIKYFQKQENHQPVCVKQILFSFDHKAQWTEPNNQKRQLAWTMHYSHRKNTELYLYPPETDDMEQNFLAIRDDSGGDLKTMENMLR